MHKHQSPFFGLLYNRTKAFFLWLEVSGGFSFNNEIFTDIEFATTNLTYCLLTKIVDTDKDKDASNSEFEVCGDGHCLLYAIKKASCKYVI